MDDHPIIRDGLAKLINREADLAVCGDAEDATSALQLIESLQPDLVIVDLCLKGADGLELVKDIRARDANLPVLMFSMLDESVYAERALRAGADGYVMKQEATEKVIEAIRRVLGGGLYLSDRFANDMIHKIVHGDPVGESPSIAELTDRELAVFRLIGEGHGTRQIADQLKVSVKTVETHQSHIKEKLALKNGRDLVQHAIICAVSARKAQGGRRAIRS